MMYTVVHVGTRVPHIQICKLRSLDTWEDLDLFGGVVQGFGTGLNMSAVSNRHLYIYT